MTARAPQFQKRLAALGEHAIVGEARGAGLVGAVELVADKKTRRSFDFTKGVGARCVQFAQDEGLIVRLISGDIVSVCPPLVILPQEIVDLFDRFGRALDKTRDWARREQLLAARFDTDQMARHIGVDSLAFISIDGLYRAMGQSRRDPFAPRFCDACFTGDYPIRPADADEGKVSVQLSLLSEPA